MLGLLFEGEEGGELALDEGEVELAALALEDAFDVEPVLFAGGEGFVNDEVFGGAEAQVAAFGGVPKGAARDARLLEGEAAEGDVDAEAAGVAQEEDAGAQRKFARIGTAPGEGGEEGIDELFVVKPGEEGEVGVVGEAGLAPALDGETADEAELPRALLAEALDVERRVVEGYEHREVRWK